MHIKQVFFAYSGKDDGQLEQYTHCPFCRTELTLKEKGDKQRHQARDF